MCSLILTNLWCCFVIRFADSSGCVSIYTTIKMLPFQMLIHEAPTDVIDTGRHHYNQYTEGAWDTRELLEVKGGGQRYYQYTEGVGQRYNKYTWGGTREQLEVRGGAALLSVHRGGQHYNHYTEGVAL